MNEKIIVKKGNSEITLEKTELNNDVQFSKTTNGKEFSITLKSFSEKEIDAIREYTKTYYSDRDNKNEKRNYVKYFRDKFKY